MDYLHPGCSCMWDNYVSTGHWGVQIFSVPEQWVRFMPSHLGEWPHIRPTATPHLQSREWEPMGWCWWGPQGRAEANSGSLKLRTSPAQHEFSASSKRAAARVLTVMLPCDVVYFGKSKYSRVPPLTPLSRGFPDEGDNWFCVLWQLQNWLKWMVIDGFKSVNVYTNRIVFRQIKCSLAIHHQMVKTGFNLYDFARSVETHWGFSRNISTVS